MKPYYDEDGTHGKMSSWTHEHSNAQPDTGPVAVARTFLSSDRGQSSATSSLPSMLPSGSGAERSTTHGSAMPSASGGEDHEHSEPSALIDVQSAGLFLPSDTTEITTPATTRRRTSRSSAASATPALTSPKSKSEQGASSLSPWPPAGVKPYYVDDAVCIILGDCREVLPDLTVDVVVTDPPYGINFAGQPTKWQRLDGAAPCEWDAVPFDAIEVVLNAAEYVCLWGANYYAHQLPVSRGWLTWIKPDAPPSMGSAEFAWTNLDRNAAHIIHSISATNAERVGHPTQKPLRVMRWCVDRMPPGTILDPFMGSGTTLRAAKDLGRKAIGIEIEEKYCFIAAQRMSQAVLL